MKILMCSLLPLLLMASIGAGPAEVAVKEVTRANNRFAVDLYGQIGQVSGNVFSSPYSIDTALAMTYAGADGETARQMGSTLHLPGPTEAMHAAFASLKTQVEGGQGPNSYQIDIANALWGQKGASYRAEFLKTLETSYHAAFQPIDFHADPEASRKTINAWVEGRTRDKIKDLLAPGVIKPSTDLVLTNAIYFKARWANPFSESATRDADFKVGGRTQPVPTMHKTSYFDYMDGGEFQALAMPFEGSSLSMVFLLPKKVDGLTTLESTLRADKLDKWFAEMVRQRIELSLPRFRVESSFEVSDALKSLGMKDAFGVEADFSGITRDRRLVISNVVHKAFVSVDEEGTEAVAATDEVHFGAKMIGKVDPPIVFQADHPFLFLIRDARTGVILFLGRLVDPKG